MKVLVKIFDLRRPSLPTYISGFIEYDNIAGLQVEFYGTLLLDFECWSHFHRKNQQRSSSSRPPCLPFLTLSLILGCWSCPEVDGNCLQLFSWPRLELLIYMLGFLALVPFHLRRPFFAMGQKGAQFLRVSSEFLCSQYFLVLSEHELLLREKHQQSWGTRVLVPMYQNSGALSRWPTDFLFQQTWALETVLFLFFHIYLGILDFSCSKQNTTSM